MNGQMQDKVGLVTGGGSGIGRATALLFAREGAKVVVADLVVKDGEETVRRIREAGGEAVFIKADVSQRSEVEILILKAVEKYGRVDCGCNIAGIRQVPAFTADCTEEDWDHVINVNLKGVWLCMKSEIAQMVKQGGGTIINMASGLGLVGAPSLSAYVASKHGVVGLTKTAALEYATAGIRVNAICPGFIHTELLEKRLAAEPGLEAQFVARIPMKRLGRPEEIAETVVWLCTSASSYMTGHALIVDGGTLAA